MRAQCYIHQPGACNSPRAMPNDKAHIDIPMARVSRTSGNLVEVFIRADVRIDIVGINGAMQARRELLPDGSGPVFFHAVGDLDWEPAALKTDLFGADAANITALAVLVNNKVLAMVATMYFGLFPAQFPTKISSDENEIREWLAAH